MNHSQNDFAFNVRNIRAISGDRKYRVYFRAGEFVFVRVGGQNMDFVAMQFGLIGGLIAALCRRGEMPPEKLSNLDAATPQELLSQHKHNFSVASSDMVESLIEPPPMMPQHGPCVGRWTVRLRDGSKWLFEFEDIEQIQAAIRYLPSVLGPAIRVAVQWDEKKQRYRKAEKA